MTTSLTIPSLERPAFFDGQRLEAADMTAVFDYLREVRWLHNQSLHGWGIAVGFAVTGAKGDRSVTIAPGYALDCNGHDIVLSSATTLEIPPVAGALGGGPAFYYLTASYVADDALAISETRDGICQGEGAVRRTETPLLRWQDPKDTSVPSLRYRRGLDIVLASIQVQGCTLAQDASSAERRSLIPPAMPHIASGVTALGSTVWAPWVQGGNTIGATVAVDTSAGGFGVTPVYRAQVSGPRILTTNIIVDGFATIAAPTPTGFTLQLVMPRNVSLGGPVTLNPDSVFIDIAGMLGATMRWYVTWMGVEG